MTDYLQQTLQKVLKEGQSPLVLHFPGLRKDVPWIDLEIVKINNKINIK